MSSNRSFNILASEARTGVVSSSVIDNLNTTAAHFIVNITSLSASQTLTLDVIAVTESGAEYTIFTTLPMNQAATYRSALGPFVTCVPGIACRDFVPKRIYFKITPSLPSQTDTYTLDAAFSV